MFNSLIDKYQKLGTNNKNIYPILVIFNFSSIILNSFIGIISLKENNSLEQLLFFALLMMTSSLLTIISFNSIFLNKIIKLNNILKTSIYINSFIYLITGSFLFIYSGIEVYYIFSIFMGISTSLFWLFLHHYELINVKKDKEFYISLTTFATQFLSIFIPIYAALMFFLSKEFIGNENILIFLISGLLNIVGIYYTNKLNYIKKIKIKKSNISLKEIYSKNKEVLFFTYFDGVNYTNRMVVYSFITLMALKDLLDISIFSFFVSIFSLLITLYVSSIITKDNSTRIMQIGILGITLAYLPMLILGINLNTYIWWTLMFIVFAPKTNTIRRLISLESFNIILKKRDYTSAIIFREKALSFSRISTLIFYILLFQIMEPYLLIYFIIIISIIFNYFEYIYGKNILNNKLIKG